MPNEFIARNGIIARSNSTISGSFFVSGSTTVAGNLFLTGSGNSAQLVLSDGNYIYGGGSVSGANTIFGVVAGQTELYARNNRIGIWSPGGGSNYLYSVNGDFGIGVGATAPSARLHISGASSANLLRIDSPASSSILFVSGSGRIGIGSSNPQFKLDILDATGNLFNFRYSGGSYGQAIDKIVGILGFSNTANNSDYTKAFAYRLSKSTAIATQTDVKLHIDLLREYSFSAATDYSLLSAGKVTAITLDGAGNLGIGSTNPSATLHVSGSSSSSLLLVGSPAVSNILFISGSGNIGIGLSNPQTALDVNGIIRLTGTAGSGFLEGSRTIWESTTTFKSIGTNAYQAINVTGQGLTFGSVTNQYMVLNSSGNFSIGTTSPTSRLHVRGAGATSATTIFLLQNSTPTNLMTVLDNGQFTISSPVISLAASQSAYIISQSISASNAIGGNYYAVNITPTFFQTTASQTETAFRVAATFTQSSVLATGGTNIIADFGATSVGSQLTVTDITSGSIYMVNDVSGLPIIEATSDWTVNMYNFPNIVLQKTGSQVNINGTLRVSGSFILPLSQSTTPQTGSAYWSGSLLFIYDGTRYRSSSFA